MVALDKMILTDLNNRNEKEVSLSVLSSVGLSMQIKFEANISAYLGQILTKLDTLPQWGYQMVN